MGDLQNITALATKMHYCGTNRARDDFEGAIRKLITVRDEAIAELQESEDENRFLEKRGGECESELIAQRKENAALRDRAEELEGELSAVEDLNGRIGDEMYRADKKRQEAETGMEAWREREAACCPEDVGFDEYIAALKKKLQEEIKTDGGRWGTWTKVALRLRSIRAIIAEKPGE